MEEWGKFIIFEVTINYQEATVKRVLLNIEHLRPELLFKIKERIYMKWSIKQCPQQLLTNFTMKYCHRHLPVTMHLLSAHQRVGCTITSLRFKT